MLKQILAYSVSRRVKVIALFFCLCLKGKLGLCSMNCHAYAVTVNRFVSLQILAKLLLFVSAMTGYSIFNHKSTGLLGSDEALQGVFPTTL